MGLAMLFQQAPLPRFHAAAPTKPRRRCQNRQPVKTVLDEAGPLHQAPFLLAAGFGIVALVLSVRLRESAAKAPAEKASPAPFGVRIMTILRSDLALYALAFFV